MLQCPSQKVKASLPVSHTCPSINVFAEKPAESTHSAFFHLPKEAKVTPLPNKSSLLRQPCEQLLQTEESSSALCAARPSPGEQRQSQFLSWKVWQLGVFVPCCMHRLVSDSPREEIESCLHAVVFWHPKQTWQISDSSKVRSSDFKRMSFEVSTAASFRIFGLSAIGITECNIMSVFMQKTHICIFENSHIWKLDRLYIVKIPNLFICIQLQSSGWLQHLTVRMQ